ncbi:MAG TPA: stage V sporulation protein E [Clostridiales bacterium]|nr:stage V sporulation protein E [Clostridiales bacterium]
MVTKKPIDFPILLTTVILVAIGIVMVFSASFYYSTERWNDGLYFFKRQCLWAVVGFIGMFIASRIDYSKLQKYSRIIMILSIVLLVLVLLIGETRNFAKRWLGIGAFTIQPAEVAKFAMIFFIADTIARGKGRIRKFFTGMLPILLVAGLVFGLIILQPNLSTAGSIIILTMAMLFVGGANLWHLAGLVAVGAFGAVVLTLTVDYRLSRLTAFLDPWADPMDSGWQLIQSLYSLGSGGIFGLGLAQSRQKYLYLPYPETDFIFAIIGEETGFVGATLLILLFLVLIWRGIRVALTAPDLFGSLLAAGIISMITIQVVINIAVVTASMPPTGLPLPFISYGGSSLAMFMTGIGVLLNISRHCKAA